MLSREMKQALLRMVDEDNKPFDLTSAILEPEQCRAVIKAKEECVLAGLEEAQYLFESSKCSTATTTKDGSVVKKNSTVLEISGENKVILGIERIALNVLGRMSGVATLCRKAQGIAGENVKVALTRKTMPAFNDFDKKAARIAGIFPHRRNLGEGVLIKDNHLFFFKSVKEAMARAKAKKYSQEIELEASSLKQALEAAENGANMIMLDNFKLQDDALAVRALRDKFPEVKIELSGGITLKNLKEYAELQPDYISMGFLTKNAQMADFSLEVVE